MGLLKMTVNRKDHEREKKTCGLCLNVQYREHTVRVYFEGLLDVWPHLPLFDQVLT